MPKRLSVPLSAEAEEALNSFAKENEVSLAEAAQMMIAYGLTVEALRLRGNIIFVTPDGKEQVLRSYPGQESSLLTRGARERWLKLPEEHQSLVWFFLTKEEQKALLSVLPTTERKNILASLTTKEQNELADVNAHVSAVEIRLPSPKNR